MISVKANLLEFFEKYVDNSETADSRFLKDFWQSSFTKYLIGDLSRHCLGDKVLRCINNC